jgi:hypothetical protein
VNSRTPCIAFWLVPYPAFMDCSPCAQRSIKHVWGIHEPLSELLLSPPCLLAAVRHCCSYFLQGTQCSVGNVVQLQSAYVMCSLRAPTEMLVGGGISVEYNLQYVVNQGPPPPKLHALQSRVSALLRFGSPPNAFCGCMPFACHPGASPPFPNSCFCSTSCRCVLLHDVPMPAVLPAPHRAVGTLT